jgi:hypothetical protein
METFPAEVLISIIKHMRQEELLTLSLVCKRFDEIINHYKLIRRIYLESSGDKEIFVLRRTCSEIEFKYFDCLNLEKNIFHQTTCKDFLILKN